jgi:hypothetical protein
MIKIDLNPNEFVFIYDMLSTQTKNDIDPMVLSLRSKFRNNLLSLFKERENVEFDKWMSVQKKKINKLSTPPVGEMRENKIKNI